MNRGWVFAVAGLRLVFSLSAVETEVLFDGGDPRAWSTARDGARLARELAVSELCAASAPPALQWSFVPRGVSFNDIFFDHPIARRFDTLRLLVENVGAGFTFACKVRDAGGADWTAGRVALKAGEAYRWVEFPASEWSAAPWSHDVNAQLDFPLASLALIAFDIRTGTEYKVRVARIEVVRPDPPTLTVSEVNIPSGMKAGQTYPVSLNVCLNAPAHEDEAYLSFRNGSFERFRIPLDLPVRPPRLAPGSNMCLRVDVAVPQFAFGGRQSVSLHFGDAHLLLNGKGADQELAVVTVKQRRIGRCTAAVKVRNGAPTLVVNGEPRSGMAWATYHPTPEVFGDFARAGISLYTFAATPTESGYGLSRTAWTAPETYDFSQLDERALMLLKANPNAYFFPRLYLHAPKWWSAEHPDDLVQMDTGDGTCVPFIHSGNKPAPSWASEAWRQATIEGLRRIIAHIEASPYADRVVGYHLASGTTEEWMMWGGNEQQWVDFSPVNTARFRSWLRARYGTDEKLRAAWGDVSASLAAATIPTKARRQHTELGALRDPAKEQAVVDYYLYNSELVADTIGTFAKAVKEATRHRKLVGVFYGYLLQLCGEPRQQNAGHLALENVLASPDVDFLASPTSYAFRGLGGEGTSHFMSLFDSVKLHGKLWFDENDIRTSLAPGRLGEWGRPANVAGDLLQQDKELANVIVNGSAQWWFDVGANVYSDPKLMDRIAKLAACASEAQRFDRRPADEVALVVDEKSLCYLRVADPLGAQLLVRQVPALARLGAPAGHYLVTDLPRLTDRKVFIFPTSFAPTARDRAAIDALKRDGHVLVFLYAPGVYRDGQLDEAGMADLTGIRLRMTRDPGALQVKLASGHPLTEGLSGLLYGAPQACSPVVYADDPAAAVLGTLPDGRAGAVVKANEGWTAIYSSAPLLPALFLRSIARSAGAHVYIDTEDVVWASRELVGVCVKEPGRRTVRLPRKVSVVRDLYTGEVVAEDTTAFEADFGDRATRVFVTK